MRRKKERSKQGQTNKAKQHSTPKAVTFPRKNELSQVHVHVYIAGSKYIHEVASIFEVVLKWSGGVAYLCPQTTPLMMFRECMSVYLYVCML